MKKLYQFIVNKEEEVLESQVSKNEAGEEIRIEKKVKKLVPKTFFLRKPTRELFDEAELFYGIRLHEGIKAGLFTRALLAKRFSNDGGVFSEPEKEELMSLYLDLFNNQNEYQKLASTPVEQQTIEDKEKIAALIKKISEARQTIQEYEVAQSSLYDQTAENRARNKTIIWWALHLAYRLNDKGESEPVFGDGDFEKRLKVYDDIEDTEDPFLSDVNKRILYYTSFWYVGRARTQEEFEQLAAQNEAVTQENEKVDEPKV